MPKSAVLVTAADISRLAGVTRATVSNWRRRHTDFPAPVGGTESSPAYDLAAVQGWLSARGQLPEVSAADELRTALRGAPRDGVGSVQLLPLVLVADRLSPTEISNMIELADDRFTRQVRQALAALAEEIPGAEAIAYPADRSELTRLVLRCVREEGASTTVDVLVESAGDDGGKTGTYATPPALADIMAALLAWPSAPYPTTVLDPACGAGGLLAAAARGGATRLYGQDVLQLQAAQAAVRLAVQAQATQVSVAAGDSMRDDAFPDLRADAVLCNPPYGNREWGHEELAYDPRWTYGLAPKGEPELAWVQHCLAHLEPGGLAVMLMPPGSAFRPAGRRIRTELVRDGALRAVIALPSGTAPPLHIALHLWILQRPRPDGPAETHLLFVDTALAEPASTETSPGRRTTTDWRKLRNIAMTAWHGYLHDGARFDAMPGVARAVPIVDLFDEQVDLTPARHVRTTPLAEEPDQQAAAATALREMLRRATTGLAALNTGAAWPPAGAESRTWRTATVADLTRGGALTLLRGPAHIRTATGRSTFTSAEDDTGSADEVTIQQGDIILTEVIRVGTQATRVAGREDAGPLDRNHILLRPDPLRLDPWFLAGFLAADENLHAASTGTTIVRIDPRRLRVPLLALDEQRKYGKAFRHLHAITTAAALVSQLAGETARTLGDGLTAGALLPPAPHPDPA